jgi:mRNA interferase RelE/StbE
MNKVKWSKKAKKQLKRIPKNYQSAIMKAASSLSEFPDCQNIIKLHDHIYDFRLRVGRYRIFFDYDGGIKIIEVQEVKKRDKRTY